MAILPPDISLLDAYLYGVRIFCELSILFDPTAAAVQLSSGLYYDVKDRSLFDNTTGTPFMFHYDTHLHAYPVWLDGNLKEERAKDWIIMLKEGFFIRDITLMKITKSYIVGNLLTIQTGQVRLG